MRKRQLANFVRVEDGQNIVEFALLLPVLMWILMGIIQFGFIFAIYITLNNAVREGARWGSIYVFDGSNSAATNDGLRNDGIVDRMIQARGIMSMAARGSSTANFSTSSSGSLAAASCPEQTPVPTSGFYYGSAANPDVTVCYTIPTGVTANDPRRGYYLDVQTFYHLQVFIPLLQQFLPDDPVKGAPWIRIPARITVVVN